MNRCFVPFPEPRTKRFRLRDFAPGDETFVFRLRSDPAVSKLLCSVPYTNISQAVKKIESLQKEARTGESVNWVISPIGSDEFIGSVCLWNLRDELNAAEIGYELLPEWRGGGVMREVVPAVLGFGFDHMGLKMIDAYPPKANARSIHLLERSGFTLVGEQKKSADTGELDLWIYQKTQGMFAPESPLLSRNQAGRSR